MRSLFTTPPDTTKNGFVLTTSGVPSVIKANLAAATDPLVTSDAAAGYAVGSIWINTTLDKVWQCVDSTNGVAVWNQLGADSTTSLKETISLTAHGFVAKNIIQKTASSYQKSLADSEANAAAVGIVESINGADTFTVVYGGKLAATAHGFTVGATLYLSQSSSGALTSTAPTTGVLKPVAIASDANSLIVLNSAFVFNFPDYKSNKESLTETAHGFAVKDVIRYNGTNYVKAQGTTGNADALGVVETVTSANVFVLVYSGRISGLTGLVAGSEYYLDATTAGAVTATLPTASGNVQKSIMTAISTTSAIVNISKIGIQK